MRKLRTPAKLDSLALHLAEGHPVPLWAEEHSIALRTAYAWAGRQEVKDRVSAIRGQLLDAGVGRLIGLIKKSVNELDRLIDGGATDNVRLAAARGVLSDTTMFINLTDLERRIAALEQKGGSPNAIVERVDSPSLPT